MKINTVILNDGNCIPQLGFGTFKMTEEQAYDSVLKALEFGYRHIDTAAIYKNEIGVGKAVHDSPVRREDIFLVSKVWNDRHGFDETVKAFEETLAKLQTDYLDLYLIHWPKEKNSETWKAMIELKKQGRVKSIGVSNFKKHHLDKIIEDTGVIPAVNQVELHPQFQQEELREYSKKHSICIESWGPLMQGQIFGKSEMEELAKKKNRTIAQITLRWHIQKGFIVLPKSVNPERIKSNREIYDFELSLSDMKFIDKLNLNKRIGPDPDTITF